MINYTVGGAGRSKTRSGELIIRNWKRRDKGLAAPFFCNLFMTCETMSAVTYRAESRSNIAARFNQEHVGDEEDAGAQEGDGGKGFLRGAVGRAGLFAQAEQAAHDGDEGQRAHQQGDHPREELRPIGSALVSRIW